MFPDYNGVKLEIIKTMALEKFIPTYGNEARYSQISNEPNRKSKVKLKYFLQLSMMMHNYNPNIPGS